MKAKTDEESVSPQPVSNQTAEKTKTIPILIVIVLLTIALIPAFYFYSAYTKTQKLLQVQGTTTSAKKDVDDLIAKVDRLIQLPKGEKPTVATIANKKKLVDQPFFEKAENGDKLLIYSKAKEAILYRPSIDKIINVGPVNPGSVQSQSQQAVTTPSPVTKQVTVTVYNGSEVSGLASTTKQKIEGKFSQIKVTATGNAAGEYSKTSVYDLTGKNKEVASQIAQFLSGEVATASLSGETKPTTDLLIIVVQ